MARYGRVARVFKNDKGFLTIMENNKLKVALICDFSNPKVQNHLKFQINILEKVARKIKKLPCEPTVLAAEHGVWISNAIAEFEKMSDEVELHVISPHGWIKGYFQEFEFNNIFYHFVLNEDGLIWKRLLHKVIPSLNYSNYLFNRKYIKKFIKKIKPDIVYMSGAENPHYSLSALDIPKSIPLVVHLQTLMNDPTFENNYPINHKRYLYRTQNELRVLQRADYIGTTVEKYIALIKHSLIPNSTTLAMRLAVGEDIKPDNTIEKKYDFVYFAANISKAVDLAIEGLGIIHKTNPDITLLVVGDYSEDYKNLTDKRINELNLTNSIVFTGRLPTHQDVLNTIQAAKYALIPLKIDIISGTIREAMACGLPVVTTITENGTPKLNERRETVLLSEIGNNQALADNMQRLLDNPDLVEQLKKNGAILMQECYSNYAAVQMQKNCLLAAYKHFKNEIPIPEEYLS